MQRTDHIKASAARTNRLLRAARSRVADETAKDIESMMGTYAESMAIQYYLQTRKGLADDIMSALITRLRQDFQQLFNLGIVKLLRASWPIFNDALGLTDNPFTTADPVVIAVLVQSGTRITGITNTIRDELRKVLVRVADEGLDTNAAMRMIRQHMTERYRNQARTIARTELGFAHAHGAYKRYKSEGITHVEIMDNGKDDPDAVCAQLNGTTQTLEWYRLNPLAHPNCTRAAAPIVE